MKIGKKIIAVAGDQVQFRAAESNPQLTTYAWDWDHTISTDNSDSDGDGINEKDDDNQASTINPSNVYNIPFSGPYSYEHPEFYVNCSIKFNNKYYSDSVTVKLNEVYLCSGDMKNTKSSGVLDDWEQYLMNTDVSDISGVLTQMHYNTRVKYKVDFLKEGKYIFPYYNIFYYVGHGAFEREGISTDGWINGYYGGLIEQNRRIHRTPQNQFRTYRFVFLNACSSAEYDFKTRFAATCFVGWKGSVKSGHARDFSFYFWRYMRSGYSANIALIGANAATIGWRAFSGTPKCQGNIILKKN